MSGGVIPALALGGATFGGVGSLPELLGRGEGKRSAFDLMDAAWDGGIRMFDTADAYGAGVSEEWIGTWIESTGHRPAITTKTYNPMPPVGDAGLSRERVLRQVAGSLERLGIEQVDLYLAHEFDSSLPIEDVVETFELLVERGVIASWGVSNFSAANIQACLRAGRPAVIQNSYSLLNRQDESEVIPLAVEHGIEYQAYSPLAGGWLSGKYESGKQMPSDSRLALVPQWYEHIDSARAFEALAAMGALAAELGTTVAALAHGWVLAQPGVAGLVVGSRRREHLDAVWAARDEELTPAVLARLAAIFG